MKRLILSGVLLATAALPAVAGPLRPGWIAADAQWVAHIDVDAIRDSRLGQFIIEHRDDLEINMDEGGLAELGIDPVTDFYGITLYGTEHPEEDGTIIVQMNHKIDGLIEKAREEADDFEEIKILGRTAYSFDGGEMHAYVHRGDSGKRTVVLAKAREDVSDAIRVIERDLPRMNADDFDPAPRDGAIVFVQATKMDWMDDGNNHASQMIKMAEGATFQCGEDDEVTYAQVLINAHDEQVRNIGDMLNGLLAMGRMMASQPDSDLAEAGMLLDCLSVSTGEHGIAIDATFPTDALIGFLISEMNNHDDDDDDDDHDDHDDHDDDEDWDN